MTGSTQEAVLAQQENDQKALADTTERLAARGDEIKRQVDAQNQQNKAGITNMKMQQAQMDENGGNALLSNGLSMLGSSLAMFGAMSGGKGANAGGANAGAATDAGATSTGGASTDIKKGNT